MTPLFSDVEAFDALVSDLAIISESEQPNVVACLDALGFILGTAIARVLGVGVVPIRKGGKLPVSADRENFVDYSGDQKALELRHDALGAHHRVLLVDDWIETGAQIAAATRLIERSGATVVGIATIHMDHSDNTAAIAEKYRVLIASSIDDGKEAE